MGLRSNIIGLSATLVFLTSCEPKPTACLDLPETLEAGTILTLESCSEDFDFLTWEFSDGVGVEGDIAQRTFQDEGDIVLRLTAYSNGAYRSDQIEQSYRTSFRYIDRFEITGNIPYDSLEVDFGNFLSFGFSETGGSFPDTDPLVLSLNPLTHIITAEPTSINLFGRSFSNSRVPLIGDRFNFSVVKDNPIVVGTSEDRYQLRVFWSYR